MRFHGLRLCVLLFLAAVVWGQTITVQVTGVTHTQAILSYVAPDANPCTIEVSESPTYTPVVHDVNPALFAGANSDAGRSLTTGQQRIVVIGKRTSDTGADGKLYSRALAANTAHYVRVTCGSAQGQTFFRTRNLGWADTTTEPPPFNSSGHGNYAWPTVDWSPTARDKEYIDPMTGVKMKLLGWPGYVKATRGEAVIGADLWWDWQGAWTNPQEIRSGGTAALASTSTANAPIFVGITPEAADVGIAFGSTGLGNYGFEVDIVDDIGLRIYGSGTDANPANREIQVCLSMDSGQNCYSSAISVTLPQGSPIDNGLFPTSYPLPMFASWGLSKPLSRPEDWPRGSGTVDVSGNTVTLTNPDHRTRFVNWPTGTKIWISGSSPTCPHNLCTVQSVISETQLTIAENINLTGATYSALNFGYRIWKTTNTGTISVSIRKAMAYSTPGRVTAGGDHQPCSRVPVVATVDRSGNPSPPKKGYLCIFNRLEGSRSAYPTVVWVAEDDGEVRLISAAKKKTSIPGHVSGDVPSPSAPSPSEIYARWDPVDGRTWYLPYFTNSGRQSIFKITYTGDFREYNPNYPSGGPDNAPDDNTVWENITKPSQGRDPLSQIEAAGIPGWNTSRFGTPTDWRSNAHGYFHLGIDPGGQDGICWVFEFDTNGNLIRAVNSYDGNVYSDLRWGACHSRGIDIGPGFDVMFTTNGQGPALFNNTKLLGGPFTSLVTAVKRPSGWDTANTSVSGTINDGSYDATCPADLNPKWQARGGTGNNCLTIRVIGQPCSAYATTNENTWWPCPYDPNKSTLAGNTLREGDQLSDRGTFESEQFLVARITPVGSELELVLVRNLQDVVDSISPPRCGSTVAKRTHANGWSISPVQTFSCAGGAYYFDPASTTMYVSSLGGHADVGVAPNPQYISKVNGDCVRSGDPATALRSGIGCDTFFMGTSFAGFGNPSGYQSYPSASQEAASGVYRYYMIDTHHTEAVGNRSMSLVSGQTRTWQIGVIGPVNIKIRPLIAWAGMYLLRDISGPGSQISDATPWTYCYAYKAGECVAGSSAGQAFVSAPTIRSASTACPEHDRFNSYSSDPCIGSFVNNSWVTQNLMHGPAKGLRRRLTMGFGGYTRQAQFARSDPLSNGRWVRVMGYWINGIRSEFLLVKIPDIEPYDTIARDQFQQTTIKISSVAGATQAVVDFGYEEFGARTDFYCTSRKERCTVPGLTPFSFASETITPSPCSSGCTITVPALPQKVLYYQIRWLDASGNTVRTSPLNAIATP